MSTTTDKDSPSKVTTEEGTNYGGMSMGVGDVSKDPNASYIESLLKAEPILKGNSRQAQRGAPNITAGNYYDSMIGNVPIFVAGGVSLPVDAIDAMYTKSQMVNMQRLQEGSMELAKINVGSFNDKYYNIQKGVVDSVYSDYLRVYKDPAKARIAMNNSDQFKRLMHNFTNYAKDFNDLSKLILEQQRNPNMNNYIPPSVQKKMIQFLATPDMLDKHIQRDGSGRIIGMDFKELTALMNDMKLYPTISVTAKGITEQYSNKIESRLKLTDLSRTSGSDIYESVIATNPEYMNELDAMVNKGMTDGKYIMMDPESQDYKDTKQMLKDQIIWNIKKDVEHQYSIIKDESITQKLKKDSVPVDNKADMWVYDPSTGGLKNTSVDNMIKFNTEYRDNPNTVGIIQGNTGNNINQGAEYNSTNFPGQRIRFKNTNLQYSLDNQHTEKFTFVYNSQVDLMKLPIAIRSAFEKGVAMPESGMEYTISAPVVDLNLKGYDQVSSTESGNLDKSKLTEEQLKELTLSGKIKSSSTVNYKPIDIEVYDDDQKKWVTLKDGFTGVLNVQVNAENANHAAYDTYDGGFGLRWDEGVKKGEEWTKPVVTKRKAEGVVTKNPNDDVTYDFYLKNKENLKPPPSESKSSTQSN